VFGKKTVTVMQAVTQRYTLDEIEKMVGENGSMGTLPKEAQEIINSLAERVGAPTYVRTPVFEQSSQKSSKSGGRNRRKNQQISDDDWEVLRTYETTQRVEKQGDEAILDLIRKYLNKISDANYESQSGHIIGTLEEHIESGNDKLVVQIIDSILKTASGNVFFSKLYARLVSELISNFGDKISDPIEERLTNYADQFDDIESVDPNTDYDKFCEVNIQNDHRRALGVFLSNLAVLNVLDADSVLETICDIHAKLRARILTDADAVVVEQMSDACAMMIEAGLETFKEQDSWTALKEQILGISKTKSKDYSGLSNKVVFKHMDIMDMIKKTE
jgi:hypothetical protein